MSHETKNNEQKEYLGLVYSQVNQIFPVFNALHPKNHTGALRELNNLDYDLKVFNDYRGVFFTGIGESSDFDFYNLIGILKANTSYEFVRVSEKEGNMGFDKINNEEVDILIKNRSCPKRLWFAIISEDSSLVFLCYNLGCTMLKL